MTNDDRWQSIPHMSLEGQLSHIARELGDDEVRVLIYMAKRLKLGELAYGALDLETDTRDFEREAIEEDADGAIYRACNRIKAKLRE